MKPNKNKMLPVLSFRISMILIMLLTAVLNVTGAWAVIEIWQPDSPGIPIISTSPPEQQTKTAPTSTPTIQPTPTPTSITTPLSFHIPAPVYYSCQQPPGVECITRDTDLRRAIAITLYNEAASISPQIAVDQLQVLDNTMRNAWNCWSFDHCSSDWNSINPTHAPYDALTIDDRIALAAYIMSRPYLGSLSQPAWNGWAVPFQADTVDSIPFSKRMFLIVNTMVDEWLETNIVGMDFSIEDDDGTIHYYTVRPSQILASNQGIVFFWGPGKLPSWVADKADYIYTFHLSGEAYYIYYSTVFLKP